MAAQAAVDAVTLVRNGLDRGGWPNGSPAARTGPDNRRRYADAANTAPTPRSSRQGQAPVTDRDRHRVVTTVPSRRTSDTPDLHRLAQTSLHAALDEHWPAADPRNGLTGPCSKSLTEARFGRTVGGITGLATGRHGLRCAANGLRGLHICRRAPADGKRWPRSRERCRTFFGQGARNAGRVFSLEMGAGSAGSRMMSSVGDVGAAAHEAARRAH